MQRYLLLITYLCCTLAALGQSQNKLPRLPMHKADSLGIQMAAQLIHHPEKTKRVQKSYAVLAKMHEYYPTIIDRVESRRKTAAPKDSAKYNAMRKVLQWRLRYLDAYYVLASHFAGKAPLALTNKDLHEIILSDMNREGWTIRKLPLHCENVTLIDCTYKNFRVLMAKNKLPASDDTAFGNNDLDVVYTLDEVNPAKTCTVKGGETMVLECGDRRLCFTTVRSRRVAL